MRPCCLVCALELQRPLNLKFAVDPKTVVAMWRSCTWHAHLLKNLNPALPCFAQNSGSRLYNSYCQRVRSKCKNLTAGNTEYDLKFHLRTVNIYLYIYSRLPQSYQSPSTLVFASFLYTCRGLLIHCPHQPPLSTIRTDHECSYRRNEGIGWSSRKTYTYILRVLLQLRNSFSIFRVGHFYECHHFSH